MMEIVSACYRYAVLRTPLLNNSLTELPHQNNYLTKKPHGNTSRNSLNHSEVEKTYLESNSGVIDVLQWKKVVSLQASESWSN